jgi:secretion/DNA translocation related TadE-like protein
MTRRNTDRTQRGTAAVMGVVLLLLGGMAFQGLMMLGTGAVLQAKADAAADAAALAAADQLALGRGEGAARAAATATAADNGAQLLTCDCGGLHAEVSVTVGAPSLPGLPAVFTSRARAEVDWGFFD